MNRKKLALLIALSVLLIVLASLTATTAWEVLGAGYEVAGDGVSLVMLLFFLTYADAELVLFLREKFEGEKKENLSRKIFVIYLLMFLLLIIIGILYFGANRSADDSVDYLREEESYSIPPEMEGDNLLPQDLIEETGEDEITDESLKEEGTPFIEDEKTVAEETLSEVSEETEQVEEEKIIPAGEESMDEGKIIISKMEEVKVPSKPEILYYIPRLYETVPPTMPKLSVSSELKEIKIPEVPTLNVTTSELREVEVPSLPNIRVSNQETLDVIPVSTPWGDESEEDFWATFYIAGEDELLYESGIYYMNLYVNDQLYGTIETYLEGDVLSLSSRELQAYVSDTITDEAYSLLFNDADDYIALSELENHGVATSYDLNTFNVYLTFSTTDMPLQIISISGNNARIVSRPIANSLVLEPAVFTLLSRYSIQASTSIYPFENIWDNSRLYISSYNTLRLFDVYGTFNYSFNLTPSYLSLAFGSYSFYHDFEDQMIRLSWGNVSPDLLYPDGTSLGIRFDKSLSYGTNDRARKSHIERYITIEKESDVQVFNEGREIYRRTLGPGNYRLEDFVLYSGANKIQIVITPLDGSDVIIDEIDLVYSSSLLAPGEMYYGAGLFTGRERVRRASAGINGAIRLPYSSDYALEYDFRNLVASGYLRAGLTTSLTMNTSIAFKNSVETNDYFNPSARYALEFTHANILGTTRYNFNITENAYDSLTLPTLYARVSHQAYTGLRAFSAINASITYNGSAREDYYNSSRLSGALNFSGSFDLLSWSLGLSGTLDLNDTKYSSWYTSATLSMNLGRNFYISGSATLSGIGDGMPNFTGRVSGTLRFGRSRASASYSNSYSNLSYTYSGSGNYFDVRVNTNDLTRFENYDMSANYSHTGDKFSFSMGLSASDMFRRNRLSFNTSFATVFADGLFAFSSYAPNNFLLIQQKGALKGNKLSIGAIGTSRPDDVAMFYNTGLYTGLSLGRSSSLTVYSSPEGSFSSGTSVDITIPESRLGGYVLRVEGENRYSVTGVTYRSDGELWINASSPVYAVTINDDNSISLEMTEYYLFTDQDGRFIVSDLLPGLYAFDVDGPNGWEMHIFEVVDDEDERYNVMLLDDALLNNYILPSPYVISYTYQNGEYVTYDEFWNLLYPVEEVAL